MTFFVIVTCALTTDLINRYCI